MVSSPSSARPSAWCTAVKTEPQTRLAVHHRHARVAGHSRRRRGCVRPGPDRGSSRSRSPPAPRQWSVRPPDRRTGSPSSQLAVLGEPACPPSTRAPGLNVHRHQDVVLPSGDLLGVGHQGGVVGVGYDPTHDLAVASPVLGGGQQTIGIGPLTPDDVDQDRRVLAAMFGDQALGLAKLLENVRRAGARICLDDGSRDNCHFFCFLSVLRGPSCREVLPPLTPLPALRRQALIGLAPLPPHVPPAATSRYLPHLLPPPPACPVLRLTTTSVLP